jgi:hypothetical protein
MVYRPETHALYHAWYAARAYAHDAQTREHLTQASTLLVNNYYHPGAQVGFNQRLVPDAGERYVMAMDRVFNGDYYSDAVSARVGALHILTRISHNPRVLSLDNAGR